MKENDIHTIVGSSVKLTGTLKDTNDIVVHGEVEGEVSSGQNIVVSETAKIKGPVSAQIINVSGEIEGTVTAHEKLELHPAGKITGNIQTKDLIIHSGAKFIGKSALLSGEEAELADEVEKEEELPVIETGDDSDADEEDRVADEEEPQEELPEDEDAEDDEKEKES